MKLMLKAEHDGYWPRGAHKVRIVNTSEGPRVVSRRTGTPGHSGEMISYPYTNYGSAVNRAVKVATLLAADGLPVVIDLPDGIGI